MEQNQKKQDRREETSYDSPDEISTDQDSRNSNKGNITEKRSVKEKKGTLSYEALKLMSKKFHREAPGNPFFREKIPYRTIAAVNFFHLNSFRQ